MSVLLRGRYKMYYVGYNKLNEDSLKVLVLSSEHTVREEAHTAAAALVESLANDEDALEVVRGDKVKYSEESDFVFIPRVTYDITG